MATGTIPNNIQRGDISTLMTADMGLTEVTINSGSYAILPMKGRGALIFASRSNFNYLGIVDYWTDNARTLISNGTAPTVEYTAFGQTIKITNNHTSGATFTVIGIPRNMI